jgi:RNA polymerase sigma-70 factor, ECF subfamily
MARFVSANQLPARADSSLSLVRISNGKRLRLPKPKVAGSRPVVRFPAVPHRHCHTTGPEFHLSAMMKPRRRGGTENLKPSFEALYDRLAERLLIYLARRLRDPDATAELWAECWAVGFESWPHCRASSTAEADAWMFGVARNQLAAYYRTGAIRRRALERLRWVAPPLAAEEREWIERAAGAEALGPALDDALAGLPPKRRQAVQLRVVEDLPYDAIAERLGCSEQTARAHVSRGLRRLKRVLAADNDLLQLQGEAR